MTEEEFRTGVMADGSRLMQSSPGYIAQALVTLSPSWHGDKVAKAQFLGRINGAIDAANKLDQVKKTLFYGRDNNLIAEGQQPLGDYVLSIMGDGNANPANIVHGVIGIFTEAGELLEALRDAYNGNGFDPINMREEIGDLFWYVAILLFEASKDGDGYTFEDAMRVNIAKLRARFPNAFTEFDAVNRDLTVERNILEDRSLDERLDGHDGTIADIIAPAVAASGPGPVAAAEAEADAAFDRVAEVKAAPGFVDASAQTPPHVGNESHLPINERSTDMPGEALARQPIREEDA